MKTNLACFQSLTKTAIEKLILLEYLTKFFVKGPYQGIEVIFFEEVHVFKFGLGFVGVETVEI